LARLMLFSLTFSICAAVGRSIDPATRSARCPSVRFAIFEATHER
jgi:hypothetical protein